MIKVLILFAVLSFSFSIHSHYSSTQEIVDYINSLDTTWKAGINKNYENNDPDDARHLMGVLPTPPWKKLQRKNINVALNIPDSFDPKEQWPNCESLKEIRDQSNCGSCWANGAAEAMSDRICIASGQKLQTRISVEDLMTCCDECGNGCNGGYPSAAWDYWEKYGIVTGDLYGDNKWCRPYTLAPHHHGEGYVVTPPCHYQCITEYSTPYNQDKHYAKNVYSIGESVEEIQTELMKYGPVEVTFSVYEDFMTYKSGVYQHKTGAYLGGHAVKLVGWGVENNVPYWLCANSWNTEWGLDGYFKIIRGKDHCGIEEDVNAGIPL